jgi:acyl carrier protein
MNDPIRCRASVVVRSVIARHLEAPVSFVLEEHALDDDLGLDALDLSMIGIALAEDAGAEIDFSLLPHEARVRDLAELASVAMMGLLAPFRRASGDR